MLFRSQKGKKVHFVCVGSDVEKMVKSLPGLEGVSFIALERFVPELFLHADMHVLAATHAGIDSMLFGAAIMRKPLIGDNDIDMSNLINEDVNNSNQKRGLTFAKNNAVSLTETIEYFIDHFVLSTKGFNFSITFKILFLNI